MPWFTKATLKDAQANLGDPLTATLRVALFRDGLDYETSLRDTAEFLSDVIAAGTELDSGNYANYARQDLGSKALTLDVPNRRTELTAAASVFTNLGAGPADVGSAVVYKFVTNDAASPVIAYSTSGGFPKPATGSDFTVTWSGEGAIQWGVA